MLYAGHRLSKDIDAFITDPQFVSLLSPRLAGEEIWACEAYQEAANHLRLVFAEGEIDFIVAAPITSLSADRRTIDVTRDGGKVSHAIETEHPVEIALKKLCYRGASLKVRDILDVAVVDTLQPTVFRQNLHHASRYKSALARRLENVTEDFLRRELDELAVTEDWRKRGDTCLERVRKVVEAIPELSDKF